MMRFLFLFGCGFVLWQATGCAIGREQSFETAPVQLRNAGGGEHWIAVAVHDRRSEVVTGDKDPDFVGLSRGGWGIPFDVTTESDAPLADDFAGTIRRSLSQAGYRPTVVTIGPKSSPQKALSRLTSFGAPYILLLQIQGWKSDTYQNTALRYDLQMYVTDRAGRTLAQARRQGEDNLGGSMWNPGGHADQAAPAAFRKILGELLNDPEIVRALHERETVSPRRSVPRCLTQCEVNHRSTRTRGHDCGSSGTIRR